MWGAWNGPDDRRLSEKFKPALWGIWTFEHEAPPTIKPHAARQLPDFELGNTAEFCACLKYAVT
jgi:hypothetical protein